MGTSAVVLLLGLPSPLPRQGTAEGQPLPMDCPGGNKNGTGVENPCGIGILREAGEVWVLLSLGVLWVSV